MARRPSGKSPPVLPPTARCEAADRFFAATGASIRHGGTRAYYAEQPDYVQMPPFETFRDAESYAATLAHELTHWTKHEKRLARDMGRIRWGDEGYAKEELVAELGSAFLCADLEITLKVREDHAAYIGHWLKALQDDKRLIFSAAAHAQRAADYLHSLQPKQIKDEQAAAIGDPFRESPAMSLPRFIDIDGAATSGAIWWSCARRRPCRVASSQPCSSCARIIARQANAPPPSVIPSPACSLR
jgi:antirestriction protein ArdC